MYKFERMSPNTKLGFGVFFKSEYKAGDGRALQDAKPGVKASGDLCGSDTLLCNGSP